MTTIMELRNKRTALWEETKAFLEEHRDEKGMVEASAVEQYDRMTADVKALGEEIKRLEAQMEMDAKLSEATTTPVQNRPGAAKAVSPTATEEYSKAFWANMRGDVSYEVRNALSTGIGEGTGNGGYTVPDEFERQLVEALDENNVLRSLAHVIRTSSGTRTIPIATDTGVASWVEEGSAINESDTTFSVQNLSAYKLACLIRVSEELLNDSAFDIASHIAHRFGVRFGNAEENAFINGTGASTDPEVPSQPTGILTTLATPSVKTDDAETITFDDVYKLFYTLKGPYRKKAKFLCNETVLLQLMLLKDKSDRYLWKPGLEEGKPDTLLGHEIVTSTYMPALESNAAKDAEKKILLFGDFDYYWIADRTNRTLKRLNELYAANGQVGFIGTQRVDGKLILPEAVKVLAMGAAS